MHICNRQQTSFYLFVTKGDKAFRSGAFSKALEIARVSFAPAESLLEMLGTKVGAATVFSALLDRQNHVQLVFDREVADAAWYGCSDGTTTGYMKIQTADIMKKFLPFVNHAAIVIEV